MTLIAPSRPGRFHGLGLVALAGHIVAYEASTHGVDTGQSNLVVADVATRRVLRELDGVGGFVDACVISCTSTTDLLVSREGAVAWITETRSWSRHSSTLAIHAAGTTGPPVALDEGPDIGATSLRLSGHILHWWRAGVERTAHLP